MSLSAIIVLGVAFILVLTGVSIYNKMVASKNRMQEAWSGTDVFLKKRYDLIPNLVETVKGYAGHEKSVLENVSAYRSAAMSAQSVRERVESEAQLDRAIGALFYSVRENYPELVADRNFKQLQEELTSIESEIEVSRRYYNGTVRANNTYIESFPQNILAGLFNFNKGEFFNINEEERDAPKVSF